LCRQIEDLAFSRYNYGRGVTAPTPHVTLQELWLYCSTLQGHAVYL